MALEAGPGGGVHLPEAAVKRATLRPWLAAPAVLAAATAFPQTAVVTGRVMDHASGAVLAGVRVVVELSGSGRSVTLPAATDANGAFVFDPAQHFSAQERDTEGLSLSFSKEGYRGLTKVRRLPGRGDFRIGPVEFRLERMATQPGQACADEDELLPLRSQEGRTLFVVPYEVGASERSREFNDRLLLTLKRRIQTHLQELNVEAGTAEVGLRSLPEKLAAADTEKIRACGGTLNALAVAAGTVTPSAAGSEIQVESEYVIIPSLARFRPGSLSIDDRIPLEGLTASRLGRRLDTLWGRGTLLALAVVEARDALAARDRARLEKARSWLVAERAQTGAGNETLVQSIAELVRLIDQELAR
jgi:hypothetical protein